MNTFGLGRNLEVMGLGLPYGLLELSTPDDIYLISSFSEYVCINSHVEDVDIYMEGSIEDSIDLMTKL